MLKDAGIPEGVVMELVGHESKAMSAHYTHVGAEALEKAVAALPGNLKGYIAKKPNGLTDKRLGSVPIE